MKGVLPGLCSHERLKNKKTDDDRLDEKKDGVERVIPLVTRDRGRR